MSSLIPNGAGASKGGFGVSVPILQALQPEIMRPDLYVEGSMPGRGIARPMTSTPGSGSSSGPTIISTLGIIFLSALIFVTLVAWLEVLRSYIDSEVVNEVIKEVTKARLYYALIVTGIAVIGMIIMFWIWAERRQKKKALMTWG